jgi:lipopolysaccharide export system permease protein
MGNIYANNELIAILNSGISLFRISLPLLLLGFLISIGSFFFEQYVVIDTYREKNLLTASLTGSSTNYNNSLVTIMTRRGELVYHAVFYNDSQKELSRPLIIERDSDGRLIKRLEADRAVWQEDKWLFYQARIYEKFNNQNGPVLQSYDELEELTYNEPPETFRRDKRNVEEMTLTDSRDWVQSQIKAGLPYKEALTDYYQRYSFPLTSLIVILISCAMGSRFKKKYSAYEPADQSEFIGGLLHYANAYCSYGFLWNAFTPFRSLDGLYLISYRGYNPVSSCPYLRVSGVYND